MDKKKVYVVMVSPPNARYMKGLVGIFSDKERALSACTGKEHMLGVCLMNEQYSIASGGDQWHKAWYPELEDEPEDRSEYLSKVSGEFRQHDS